MKSKIKIILVGMLLLFAYVRIGYATTSTGLVSCGLTSANGTISNPCTANDLYVEVMEVVDYLIAGSTALAIGFVLYGGIRMILSRGSPEGVGSAKKTMLNAITGLIIVLLAYLIVNFAIRFLSGNSTSLPDILKSLP